MSDIPETPNSSNKLDPSEETNLSPLAAEHTSLLPFAPDAPSPPRAQSPGPAPRELKAPADVQKVDPNKFSAIGKIDIPTEAELAELAACEMVVEQGWDSFVQVGLALATIRDKQLYRLDYATFKAYYRARWQFQKSTIYSLINAAKTYNAVALDPELPKPEHEAQLRPLFGLEPEKAQLAWKTAVQKSGGRKLTQSSVSKVVKQLSLKEPIPAEPPGRRVNKKKQRQVVRQAIEELLILTMQKAPHETIQQKAEQIDREFNLLIAPALVKRPSKSLED